MAVIKQLRSKDPYKALVSNDLYATGIFDQTLNGFLLVLNKDAPNRSIFIERTFRNTLGDTLHAGYYFIQCLEQPCQEDDLRQFRILLEEIVNREAKGNYMEIEPILIAPGFAHEVTKFVEQYNRLQRRKPIQLLSFEVL